MSEKTLAPGWFNRRDELAEYTKLLCAHKSGHICASGRQSFCPVMDVFFDFAEIEALQETGQWKVAGQVIADIARRLEDAGAQALLIATNTMHKLGEDVTKMPPLFPCCILWMPRPAQYWHLRRKTACCWPHAIQ